MGAEQSSARGTATSNSPPKKTDYYELLEVDRTATDDEIKKAYRKKALELHPDRNFGDVDNATRKFAEVQAAYEVLSDPQERAWYDSHSDAILRGDDPADSGVAPEYRNVRLTTTDEIYTLMGRFNKSVPLDDSPNSFFTILRETFDRLADGELAAADWEGLDTPEYPSFGESTDNDAVAKTFYGRWSSFSTRLSFSWKDKWRLSDAPDRRVRRLMEKENKKLRDDAIREFNDAVRSLVIFVRKRDPRYVPNNQSEAERQQILRDSAAAQAARARAAHQEKMDSAEAVPEWARSRGDDDHAGEFSESEDESEVEAIECVVCNKTFKSEKQFEAHEKSKKHIKAVQQLKRQMRKEDANFDLDEEIRPHTDSLLKDAAPGVDSNVQDAENDNIQKSNSSPEAESRTHVDFALPKTATSASDDESEQDDYAPRDAIEARLTGDYETTIEGLTTEMAEVVVEENRNVKKKGMAKAKKEKRAARQAAAEQEGHRVIHSFLVYVLLIFHIRFRNLSNEWLYSPYLSLSV
ncbi:DnaJ domain-containing protein [Xylaria bambusicola]|uniref:DnaJ domain-containing protein n=1 Tax=Xylaria bambusicola TaxID=326684 RepID=UPI0020072605|nr:DnaJ domain-containing protein [Xylaria bambusicola]KAI0517681.1 DnaJ domain-containing protein [Xylaria bambusicola]